MAQGWRCGGVAQDARVLCRCVPLLCAIAVTASTGEGWQFEAPGTAFQLEEGGVVAIAGRGFNAWHGEWLLSGEAMRWDKARDSLWASGAIVMVMPAVRLHADRIGLRYESRTGDAWDVEAWIEKKDVRLHVRAERVELRPDRLTFHGVEAEFGHGGALAVHCPILHIYLRDEERRDKGAAEIDRFVEGIAMVRPTVELAGVPVLWFPYLYRDYILDYPWTTVEVGHSERLGSFLRYRIGSNLPEMGGWRTRIEARADRHTRAGNGFGGELFWKHADWGRGGASLYRMARERVADPLDESREGGQREAIAYDAEHYVGGRGWALAGRFAALPDADPSAGLADGRSPDERFRADMQQRELERKPFARQGGSGAWVTPWLAFTADAERRANRDLDQTERLLGAEVSLPRLGLGGPLAVSGRLRSEQLRQALRGNQALRTAWDGQLSAVRWVGGLAFDAAAGGRGVSWSDARLAGSDLSGTRSVTLPVAEAGVRLRLVRAGSDGGDAVLSPRLGVELLGEGRGAGNPGFDFNDRIDDPDDDRQYAITALDGELRSGAIEFRADIQARWGIRQEDRIAREVDGSERASENALADLSFDVRGSPHRDVEALANGTWDNRLARWTVFDVRARWRALERVDVLYNGAYVPPTILVADSWLHRFGGSLHLNRYRIDLWGEVRPGSAGRAGGRGIDLWHLGLARRMIDGVATISYENALDPAGDAIDHRVSAGFTVGGTSRQRDDDVFGAFGF